MIRAASFILICSLWSGAQAQQVFEGRARVIDGDTLAIGSERFRLFGIDAPESDQVCYTAERTQWACGSVSTAYLKQLIGEQPVSCTVAGKPSYGRHVAICRAGAVDLNRQMVQAGMAIAYRHFSLNYVPAEEAAEAAKAGLWQGAFMEPAQWRLEHKKARR